MRLRISIMLFACFQWFHIHTQLRNRIHTTPLIYRRDLCNCTQPLYWINQNRCLRCESNLLYVHGCQPPFYSRTGLNLSIYSSKTHSPILENMKETFIFFSPPIEDGREGGGFSHLNRRNERSLKLQRFFYKTNSREFSSFPLSIFSVVPEGRIFLENQE